MKREQMGRMAISAAAFTAVAAFATRTDARVRVRAEINVPVAWVYPGNAPSCYDDAHYYRRAPARRHVYLEIKKKDRRIARRLAWFSGVPARELVRLRMNGFGWFEIGRIIYVPRPVVRAAMHRRSWNRLLADEWIRARTGVTRRGRNFPHPHFQ